MPHPHPPCHGGKKGVSTGGSFGDLLTRLGFVRPTHGHEDHHEHGHGITHHAHHEEHEGEWQVVKAWKNHVEEIGSRIVPIMEGGAVRVLDFTEGDKVTENKHDHAVADAHGHGHLKAHEGHHWHQASFTGRYVFPPLSSLIIPSFRMTSHHSTIVSITRLVGGDTLALLATIDGIHPHPFHLPPIRFSLCSISLTPRLERALSSLTPTEATIFAFVIGAGIGSILHLIFMLFLITTRRMRGLKCKSRQERREARRARREARAASKSEGALKMVGGEGEVLPAYGEDEGGKLVEKA